jgi:hypothetical protein
MIRDHEKGSKLLMWVSAVVLLASTFSAAENRDPSPLPTLAPWTAMQYQAGTLKVWGREYGLQTSILPSRIISNKVSLLSGPVSLVCRQGNSKLVAAGHQVTTRLASHGEVDLASELSFNEQLKASVTLHSEYDGLMVYHITLNPQRKVSIDELSLEIPFSGNAAAYFQKYILMNADWGQQSTHEIPKSQGVVWQSPFNPYIWVGDESEGLFWFSETDNGWRNGPAPLRLVRQGNVVKFVVSFINVPTELSEKLDFEFGLQATPTRPLPANWRSIRTIYTFPKREGLSPTEPKPDYSILWPNKDDWKYFGFPEPKDEARMKAQIQSLHDQGIKVLVYVQAEAIAANVPEYEKNIAAWQYLPEVVDNFSSDVLAMGGPIHAVNPASGWSDFFLEHLQNFLNTYDVDGLYLDNIYAYPTRNRLQYPSGTVYPIISFRNLIRKMYGLVKAKNSQNLFMIHMSAHNLMPVLSFSDLILDGEDIAARPWTCSDYSKMLNLEEFRGEIYGRQWGPAPMYLSTLGYKKCLDTFEQSKYVLSYALLHGVLLWGEFKDDIVTSVYKIYDQFGVNNAAYTPYWESGKYLRATVNGKPASDVKVSLYLSNEQGRRRSLLIVSNLGGSSEGVDIQLDFKALQLPQPQRVQVWSVDGTAHASDLTVQSGHITLDVPGYDFKLVGIGD